MRQEDMTGPHINDSGYEVPENKILAIPHRLGSEMYIEDVLVPLKGKAKRDWFSPHAYYCLPLTIANQYGFLIQSALDVEISWTDGTDDAVVTSLNQDNVGKQIIKSGFGSGIVTVQNMFALKTPPGINLMTIQPPNMYIPGCVAMSGVIECDNIRRDFTFNFKITTPNTTIVISKGDPLGAFRPIPRYFVDKFEVEDAANYFSQELIANETAESGRLSIERETVDREKNHWSGRRYFNGEYTDGFKFPDHQKRVR
jgi:hypothetical protein